MYNVSVCGSKSLYSYSIENSLRMDVETLCRDTHYSILYVNEKGWYPNQNEDGVKLTVKIRAHELLSEK